MENLTPDQAVKAWYVILVTFNIIWVVIGFCLGYVWAKNKYKK